MPAHIHRRRQPLQRRLQPFRKPCNKQRKKQHPARSCLPEQPKADCGDEQAHADDVEVEHLGAVATTDEEGGEGGEGEKGDEGGAGGLGDAEPRGLRVFPVEFFGGVLGLGVSLHGWKLCLGDLPGRRKLWR